MQILKPTSFGKTLVLLKSQPAPGQIKSLLNANRMALDHLGQGTSTTSDVKGGVLRSIRLSNGIDPAVLATQACISLAQLYAIESGEDGPFYSPFLRELTARRVAHLLHADWNNLSAQHETIHSFSNVYQLQRTPALVKSEAPVNTAAMFQKQDTVECDTSALILCTPSVENQTPEASDSTHVDAFVVHPKRSKNFQWFALILAAYAIAVFVTLGFNAPTSAQSAFDTALNKWTEWIAR